MKESSTKTVPAENFDFPETRPMKKNSFWKFVGLFLLVFMVIYAILEIIIRIPVDRAELGVIQFGSLRTAESNSQNIIRAFPDTSKGIHVFNDQLAAWEMSENQFAFSASHYAGTQKVFASDARRLRARNPGFIVLNYRLGMGLGFQNVTGNCSPDGSWLEIIEGEKWIREYPENPPEEWFYKVDGEKVFFCEWGWYLMDISNPSWREYLTGDLVRQLHANQADGIFLDGLFPPNYYGGDKFKPNLPVKDEQFENSWSTRIEDFIAYLKNGSLADYQIIANVGYLVTRRDKTDYSGVDGIFVEGFGRWADGSYFSEVEETWQLQMDRILNLSKQDKIIILQQYVKPANLDDRMFILADYLLVKGSHTFINMEYSALPEWFPEYGIPIGSPIGGSPETISSLWRSDWQVYARNYDNGLILVNPSESTRQVDLFQKYNLAVPFGGGVVPSDGDISGLAVDYLEVSRLELKPHQGAVLIDKIPAH